MIRVFFLVATMLCAAACSTAVSDGAVDDGTSSSSSKADWGQVPDVEWANQFFLTQIYDSEWNSAGVVDDADSNNCGPASLAMLMAERGTTPAGLDAEMAIDHARAMMYPGYPDIDTLLLPEGALLYEDQGLVFVDDDSHSVYFDLMAYDPSVPQGIAQQGGEAVFGYTWDALDTLLEAHGAVIAHGHITDTWRERFTGEYGSLTDGAVSHFIAVFVSTVADSYVVCDPMHRGGAVLMTQGELQAFFQSPVSVYDTTIRLVAWEGASEEEEEVEVEEEIPEVEVDPYAMALDVTAHHVTFDEGVTADDYETPYPGTGFNLSGHEFWQKWSGGKNPTYLFGEGSDYGKRCMVASAKRFEAMMSDPPQAIQDLKSGSNWGGSFFNWNDDYALSDWGDGTSARLWAWKTGLIKWISQTNRDGSCYLPTLEMVETLAGVCLERAAEEVGEIVGCKAP